MRTRGGRTSLRAKDIIHRATKITSKIDLLSKLDQIHRGTSRQSSCSAINLEIQTLSLDIRNNSYLSTLPRYLSKYLCDFCDIQSLLRLQITNRYLCVITRSHYKFSLMLTISPYNLVSYDYNMSYDPHTPNNGNSESADNYLHSVNETALNSGYYKKFFVPIKKLGSGSYGQVFLVNHIMHGIYLGRFAMKIVCVGDDITRLIDILREVRTLQQLHHRNVIDYKHAWLENYQPAASGPDIPCLFMLMEYADMGSILDYVLMEDRRTHKIRRKWLDEHEIWTIMFETCMGLKHLHQHGIVHRDIKPGNLLMTSLHTRHKIEYEDLELYDTNYRIVISDLGQADFVNHKESVRQTGNTGAYGFASPELVLGIHFIQNRQSERKQDDSKNDNDIDENEQDADMDLNEWDESVDIWSLGQLLYFLTFSTMPYENCLVNADGDDIMNDDELPEIHEFYKDIINGRHQLYFPPNNGGRSQVMINMIHKLCQLDPKQRPSLDSVIMAIANILRSHQYISISYSNPDPNRFRALTAPTAWNASANNDQTHDVSAMPVIKYVPKYKALQALLLPQQQESEET